MSEVMLHGVLNMPIDIWSDEYHDKVQRHSRYVQASKLITEQEEQIRELKRHLKNTNSELCSTIQEVNFYKANETSSTDLDPPDLWDFETVFNNDMLLNSAQE